MKIYFYSFCFLLSLAACNKEKTFKPEYKPFVDAVYASGKIQPLGGHKIFAMNDGILDAQLINEGDKVSIGQAIFKIENNSQNARLRNAREIYKVAIENTSETSSPVLQELKNQINSAKTKLLNDSINYTRFKNLLAENATTNAEYDSASLAFKLSKGDYSTLQQRYAKTKNDLFLSLQNARSQQEIMAEDASYTTVKSDMEGLLYETYKKQGEAVRRNDAVAYVGNENRMYLQLWIDEEDVYKIREGQEAMISIDMYKDKVFKATITKIYPVLNAENQSVRVDAEFKEDMPALVANASAEANIIIAKKDKGLALSKNLVFGGDSVLIKTSDGQKKVKIKKGIETTDYVEVVSGLDANSEVISTVKE